MSTAKVKKKQIKDFGHQIDDPLSHSVAPEGKRGRLVKTNAITGEIELVEGTKMISIAGFSGYISNVNPGFQIEFYTRENNNLTLLNLSYRYREVHSDIYWTNSFSISNGLAIIKQQ